MGQSGGGPHARELAEAEEGARRASSQEARSWAAAYRARRDRWTSAPEDKTLGPRNAGAGVVHRAPHSST